MSQESGESVAAAMGGMDVGDVGRTNSELQRAADELEAEINGNAAAAMQQPDSSGHHVAASGLLARMEDEEGVKNATGKGGSDDDDIFSSEEDEDEDEAAAAARAKLIKECIKAGKDGGIVVKPLAAELYVDNVDVLYENGWKNILDFEIEDDKKVLYKKHVQAAMDSCKVGVVVERAATQDFFAASQEEEVEEDEDDDDDDLQELSQAKLIAMLGETTGKIEIIEEKLKDDPLKVVLKEFASGYKGKAADEVSRAKELVSYMKDYIKTEEFINMASEKRELIVKLHTAMHEKKEELPKQLNMEKAEKERLEEIVKQKALEAVMGKAAKAANKTKAKAAASAPPPKRRK